MQTRREGGREGWLGVVSLSQSAFERELTLGSDTVTISCPDNAQKELLGGERQQILMQKRPPAVLRHRGTLPHREHACFGTRVLQNSRYVSTSEHIRRVGALHSIMNRDKAFLIQRKPGVLEPGLPGSVGAPDAFVERDFLAVGACDFGGVDVDCFTTHLDLHEGEAERDREEADSIPERAETCM